MKTALVLGGAGFLGSHLIPKLLERGYEVTAVDPAYEKIGKPTATSSWMNAEDFLWDGEEVYDYIFHLAASLTKSNIAERNKMGVSAFSDTQLDYSVARWLEARPPRERAVWLSSAAVDARDTENYAFVKSVSERFARSLSNVPISILKPYGGYGPGQSLNYPMPAIIDRALRREDPLVVWGNPHTIRDWIYVDDLIEAILMAADGKFPALGHALPIGTGIPTSFATLANMIAEQVGYSPKISVDYTKPVGSGRRVAETQLAKLYGFEAKVNLADGIAKCIAAQRQL